MRRKCLHQLSNSRQPLVIVSSIYRIVYYTPINQVTHSTDNTLRWEFQSTYMSRDFPFHSLRIAEVACYIRGALCGHDLCSLCSRSLRLSAYFSRSLAPFCVPPPIVSTFSSKCLARLAMSGSSEVAALIDAGECWGEKDLRAPGKARNQES